MKLLANRVVRTFGILFTLIGGLLLAAYRVIAEIGALANDLVGKAFARYSSFTGKMALENFPEDKLLFSKVKMLKTDVLPILDTLLPLLLIIACVTLLLALLCLALPRQTAQVLVALKIWKSDGENVLVNQKCTLEHIKNRPSHIKRKIIASIAALFVIVVVLCISFCSRGVSIEDVNKELSLNSIQFITELKENFKKSKNVNITPLLKDSEYFSYTPKKGGFTATLKQMVNGCPAGSSWKITSEVKGLFQKELKIYRKAPLDSACESVISNFKHIGRQEQNPVK